MHRYAESFCVLRIVRFFSWARHIMEYTDLRVCWCCAHSWTRHSGPECVTYHFKFVVILVDALGIGGKLGATLAIEALDQCSDAFPNKLTLSEARTCRETKKRDLGKEHMYTILWLSLKSTRDSKRSAQNLRAFGEMQNWRLTKNQTRSSRV
jgi:hypothetical protein